MGVTFVFSPALCTQFAVTALNHNSCWLSPVILANKHELAADFALLPVVSSVGRRHYVNSSRNRRSFMFACWRRELSMAWLSWRRDRQTDRQTDRLYIDLHTYRQTDHTCGQIEYTCGQSDRLRDVRTYGQTDRLYIRTDRQTDRLRTDCLSNWKADEAGWTHKRKGRSSDRWIGRTNKQTSGWPNRP